MKTTKFDGSDLRLVLCGMITDQVVCSRIVSQWRQEGLFDADWANLVGNLVVRHYQKFSQCPNGQMRTIFESWVNDTAVEDKKVAAIETFLQSLSDTHEIQTSEYILDRAGVYFDKVQLQREIDAAQAEIQMGEVRKARDRLRSAQPVNLGLGSFIQPAADPDIWIQSFSTERKRPLVTYPGALGGLVGSAFLRGNLYSFMATEKSGKSAWMIDFAYRGLRSRNRVAFFDTGDSNEEEVMIRFGCRAAGKPEFDGAVSVPSGWNDNLPIRADVEMDQVDPIEGYRNLKKICKAEDALRISCHENSSVCVADIDGILEDWSRSGWRPDIIVIDYADILAPEKGRREINEQVDETWKSLRRLSQHRHALTVTATQVSAEAYKKEEFLFSKKHFQGRRTKFAHVNGMLGINVSPNDRDNEMCRVNWVTRRKGAYNEKHFVRVAGCYSIGNPVVTSKR